MQYDIRTIGITGGIGSGKSLVSRILSCYGIPIYDTDSRAKGLYDSHDILREQLISTFGAHIYTSDSRLDRKALASIVFADRDALARINALVHPLVQADFIHWRAQQATLGYQVCGIESALLVGRALQGMVSDILVVVADTETRIRRAVQRDQASRATIEERIKYQTSQSQLLALADWVIHNDDSVALLPQIEALPWLPNRKPKHQ